MRAMGPLSRSRLLNVARAVEYELQGKRGGATRNNGGRNHFGSGSSYRSNSYYPYGPNSTGRPNSVEWAYGRGGKESSEGGRNVPKQEDHKRGASSDKGVRHLPYQELLDRRQKGLCFKCGGPFNPRNHQCPERHLRLLVIDEEDEGEAEIKVLAESEEEEVEVEGECSVVSWVI